jgi:AcrR family transcriptional regulator
MAKSGAASRFSSDGTARSAGTKRALIDAAVETLKSAGFCGASARAIAERAGCNQALIFYHFGSVVALLLAALDDVSTSRLARYRGAVEQVGSLGELVDVAGGIISDDLDAGHVAVLVEMIAGSSSTPGLGPEVAERIAPWTEFARQSIDEVLADSSIASLLPSAELAHAVVALYLGLELLAQLDGDRGPATALFDRARALVAVLEALGVHTATRKEPSPP